MKNAFCRIQIDFDALLYNYRQVKNLHPELMPVIKANAYAHGAVEIARFLKNRASSILPPARFMRHWSSEKKVSQMKLSRCWER